MNPRGIYDKDSRMGWVSLVLFSALAVVGGWSLLVAIGHILGIGYEQHF